MKDQWEVINEWMKLVVDRLNKIETKLDRSIHVKDCLEGDQLLDNQDLCLLLGVTKRTLRRYRQKNIIKYYSVNKRKVYYKKSEIPDFLIQRKLK